MRTSALAALRAGTLGPVYIFCALKRAMKLALP